MKLATAILLGSLMSSCYEDKGNYDYHPINEVKISDWKKGGYTAIFKNDTLKITPLSYLDTVRKEPVIQFTEDSDPSRYEYEWKAGLWWSVWRVPPVCRCQCTASAHPSHRQRRSSHYCRQPNR